MSLKKLKNMLNELDNEESPEESESSSVEVICDSIAEGLEIAAQEFNINIDRLDYQIIQRGTSGFMGLGKTPYRLWINVMNQSDEDLAGLEDDLGMSLHATGDLGGVGLDGSVEHEETEENMDGYTKVRVLKTGVWLWVYPPKGKGKPETFNGTLERMTAIGLTKVDMDQIEKIVKARTGEAVKIGNWKPNPEFDATISIEISEDEMSAWAHFSPPRGMGRHLDFEDVVRALESSGVYTGINEEKINKYLEEAKYDLPLEAASGTKAKHGADAQIEYKVRISKEIKLEEDESGKVDYSDLDLVENVVVGQILAVKQPAGKGVAGRTVTNRLLEAKDGRDGKIRHGKGTILSDDGLVLTAEINGEVIFSNGRISVLPVKTIVGDVGTSTGSIVFLGSVVVTGSVQDNFSIKAAGKIEIKGSVQKAHLEAEGDIVIRGGIQGRDEARIESTGGSIYAKFIQSATVVTEGDIFASEGILHSHLDAGEKIICDGKRAQIVGGVIRSGKEIKAKTIGSESFTKTEIRVGFNPKLLQRVMDLEKAKAAIEEKKEKAAQTIKYLQTQKRSEREKFSEDKKIKLDKLESGLVKYENQIKEIDKDREEMQEYLMAMDQGGVISVDKTIWPNVHLFIQDCDLNIQDEYNHVSFIRRGNDVAIVNHVDDEEKKKRRRRKS